MPDVTKNPTDSQTPDATLGGNAVSGVSDTGHTLTLCDAVDGSTVTKSARWFGVPAGGAIQTATLKIDHSSQGSLSGGGAQNTFTLSYSLNGGSNWTNVVSRSDFTSLESDTASVSLSPAQDLTQVQVRDFIQSVTGGVGETADTNVAISDIRIEIDSRVVQPLVCMM